MFHHKQSLQVRLTKIPGLKKLINKDRDFKEFVKMIEVVCYVNPVEIENYMLSILILSSVNASKSCFCSCLWFCSSF